MLPMMTFSFPLFIIMMGLWSMLSWAISPAQQNYLIEIAPESAGIQQSLNNSALHLGIALGSTVGGVVIEKSSVIYNAWVGGGFIILACFVRFSRLREDALLSLRKKNLSFDRFFLFCKNCRVRRKWRKRYIAR